MKALRIPLRAGFEWIEGMLDRAFGTAWNPFYCLGALGFYYFWIVAVSGVYIYVFFDTGIPAAFGSVEYLTHDQWYLGGIMRSLHRYASDAMVVMMGVHMVRVFAFDRYRGPRWFSWLTGVPMIWLLLVAGITGYWLVWDKLAQYIAVATTEWFDWLPIFGEPVARNFLNPSSLDSRFFTLMVFVHIAVPLILLFVMWFHLQRATYARVNPPRGLAWGTLAMLIGLSLIKPAVSHDVANLSQVPTDLALDWFYLWPFALIDVTSVGFVWMFAIGGSFVLAILPWMPPIRRIRPALVDLDNCNGCRRCADDCPFGAIMMKSRTDGTAYLTEASVDPDLCLACGICVGSCPTATPFRRRAEVKAGIELPGLTLADLRETLLARAGLLEGDERVLVFGCDHANGPDTLSDPGVAWIALPCTAMLPPSFIDFVVSRGLAEGVVITGCRDGECNFRQGPKWMDGRLAGTRDPHLRGRVPADRLLRVWAAPSEGRHLARQITAFRAQLAALPANRPVPPPPSPPSARRLKEPAQ